MAGLFASKRRSEPFDPEGDGYDYETARARGMTPSTEPGPNFGHMYSRDPVTGMILKGRRHESFDVAIQDDAKLGYRLVKRGSRYFTLKDEE